MNEILESVWNLANQFMADPKYVFINNEKIKEVADDIRQWFDYRREFGVIPKCIGMDDPYKIEKLVIYELLASSVNYCYWYGRSDIRPKGASAPKMYELLDTSFKEVLKDEKEELMKPGVHLDLQSAKNAIAQNFANRLMIERFPMVEQRVAHLKELEDLDLNATFLPLINKFKKGREPDVDEWIETLVQNTPGFAGDLFLKRAILFVMQLHRRYSLFLRDIRKLPVPADYQVPKMLRHFDCIEYASFNNFAWYVNNGVVIPEGSPMECEIRAATIIVCKMIADHAGCTCEQVDTYLWSKRNECSDPFHLTITTNY